jgi:hypothetical protein
LLHVDVVREVPEAAKPRTIKIGTTVETVQPQVTQQKRPNRHVGRHCPKVRTPPNFGGVCLALLQTEDRVA